ncbi:MAG: hypothetical protein C0501_14750 [Isosphaera sp.]|nr:hypothetical protein [Isosphaera sp.]
MNPTEDVIDATLEADGTLRLAHPPRVAPGPVRVTIRTPAAGRGLADVLREIAADQRTRGDAGRTAEELRAGAEEQSAEDEERDRELAAARRPSGGP